MANCCNCPKLIKTTNVELSGSTIMLTIPNQEIKNGEVACICIANLPTAWTGSPPNIMIIVNGTKFYCLNQCGNFLYADQFKNCNGVLQTKQIIKVRFSTDSNNAVYVGASKLCNSAKYIAPIAVPSSAT